MSGSPDAKKRKTCSSITEWVDLIINSSEILEKDINGTWVKCKYCKNKDLEPLRIHVRGEFGASEWFSHAKTGNHMKK